MRLAAAILITLLLAGTLAAAEVAPVSPARAARVATLADWARGPQGRDKTLQIEIVRMFGLGESALPAKRKAYVTDDKRVTYSIYVVKSEGRDAIVMARLAPGQNNVWNIGPAGEIKDAVVIRTHGGIQLDKEPYLDLLEETIKFLEHVSAESR